MHKERKGKPWPNNRRLLSFLHAARVEHNADLGTDGTGREVGRELGADDTVVSVGAADLAPDAAVLGAVTVLLLALVHESDLLAEVKVNVFSAVDTFDLDEGSVHALRLTVALESEVDAVHVQSARLGAAALSEYILGLENAALVSLVDLGGTLVVSWLSVSAWHVGFLVSVWL